MPLAGRPVLWHVVSRLRAAQSVDSIVVATSVDSSDDAVSDACAAWRVPCVRGSLNDVLSRCRAALETSQANVIVRMPSDKPLLDPEMVDQLVNAHVTACADYTTNMGAGWPNDGLCPMGHEVEVASANALRRADAEATLPSDREHVMPYLYARGAGFTVQRVVTPNPLAPYNPRLNLDTPEDYAVISAVYDGVSAGPRGILEYEDVKHFLSLRPELTTANAHIQQRGYA